MTGKDATDVVLAEARQALNEGRSIYEDGLNWRLHALAEAHDEKAKAFFVEVIRSARDDIWRLETLCDIGFHYDLSGDAAIIDQIREMLNDPDIDVRMAAASVLGIRSSWPDHGLYRTMTMDPNEFVRRAAFRALVRLSGNDRKQYSHLALQILDGKILATPANLKALIGEKFTDLVLDE
jgi:HEAT repeat protein